MKHNREEDAALAQAAAQPFGTIRETESVVGLEGVQQLFHGDTFTVLVGTPARAIAEEVGARVAHPLAPRFLGRTERAWVIERVGAAPAAPLDALVAAYGGRTERIQKTLGELLAHADVLPARALVRCGVARSRVDRALGQTVSIELEVGPSLGGASPLWLRKRAGTESVMSVVMRRAEPEGWPVIDLAAAEVRSDAELATFFIEHPQGKDRAARALAYEIALLRVAMREVVIGNSEEAVGLVLSHFEALSGPAPERVHLSIEAPAMLDTARYAPLGEVTASHARFVMRALDGVTLNGDLIRVKTEPAIRAGRATRPFEAVRDRLERIFGHPEARFDEVGMFSATPVKLAREVVAGLKGVVIDGTCGLGCLAMAAAELPEVTRVIAIDNDPQRLELARHNARLRRMLGRIEFMEGDLEALLPTLEADGLVLDPPWGGRDYERGRVSLADLPLDVRPLVARFRGAVRLKLPRGVYDLPKGFAPRAIIDDRGALKFLLASRG